MVDDDNEDDRVTNDDNVQSHSSQQPPFYDTLHVRYIANLATKLNSSSSYEGAVTEHLRMSGVYWSIAALSILRPPNEVDVLMGFVTKPKKEQQQEGGGEDVSSRGSIVDWVFQCYDPQKGGFGGNIGHDAHLLYTLSAIQILAMADMLDEDARYDKNKVGQFVASLQQGDGSFAGDEWGEIDTRFSYCALSTLSLLGMLPPSPSSQQEGQGGTEEEEVGAGGSSSPPIIDLDKAVEYLISCQNFDGGFGCIPGAESHAGQIFCCVGALAIAGGLDRLVNAKNTNTSSDLLCWWLAERQCDSGGLNGRPEKQADVCYSWWILSALSILGRTRWINRHKLTDFILKCQDDDDGGIADRPSDMADVFHTFFGVSGLSLLGYLHDGDDLRLADDDDDDDDDHGEGNKEQTQTTTTTTSSRKRRTYREIDPLYALPRDVVERLNLRGQVIRPKDNNKDAAGDDDRLERYDGLESESVKLRL